MSTNQTNRPRMIAVDVRYRDVYRRRSRRDDRYDVGHHVYCHSDDRDVPCCVHDRRIDLLDNRGHLDFLVSARSLLLRVGYDRQFFPVHLDQAKRRDRQGSNQFLRLAFAIVPIQQYKPDKF